MVVAEERIEIPVKDELQPVSFKKLPKFLLIAAVFLVFVAMVSCCHTLKRWVLWQASTPARFISLSGFASDAVCLDGSPAGIYFSPAKTPQAKNSWIIFFEGGGWCYNPVDCWGRSQTDLGSSKKWGKERNLGGGIISDDCTENPGFCNFNRAYLPYCDGNSFSGDLESPIRVRGDPVYFRGSRILDAALKYMVTNLGLTNATEVMLSGCSAGGLSTFLHANKVGDFLKQQIPGLQKFKAVPVSGFFLHQNNVQNVPVYPDEMKTIFNLSNAISGVDQNCVRAHANSKDQYLCNFAQYVYPFVSYPIFPLNSKYDAWQIPCIYTAIPPNPNSTQNGDCGAVPGWQECAKDPTKCDSNQRLAMNGYQQDFLTYMEASPTFHADGNGAFIDNTWEHCAGRSSLWTTLTIGGVTMHDAVLKWWNGPMNAAPGPNTHICSPDYPGTC